MTKEVRPVLLPGFNRRYLWGWRVVNAGLYGVFWVREVVASQWSVLM